IPDLDVRNLVLPVLCYFRDLVARSDPSRSRQRYIRDEDIVVARDGMFCRDLFEFVFKITDQSFACTTPPALPDVMNLYLEYPFFRHIAGCSGWPAVIWRSEERRVGKGCRYM